MNSRDISICEEKNFKEIFTQNSEIIRNFIFYKCGDIDQAEDLTQDAFIKLWDNCKKIPFAKAKSFVMKVAQNSFFNNVRHQKVVLEYTKNDSKSNCDLQSPEYILEEKEFFRKITTEYCRTS
ncbi:RNA polymerase sigma factor [Aquimarina agarivorans]|uniref:RNA polymerase sigma factor n=1 Tax=Aquimarina agarivorans TaxID=980584 RepID=UPI000248E790|nr:sigma-70 family RNA polymerase sigma factor [Aquimarina agarivorans]